MLVEAKSTGFFGNKRIKEGQQFEIKDMKIKTYDHDSKIEKEIVLTAEKQFSERWMSKVSDKEAKAQPKQKVKLELNDNETVI